MLLCSPFQRHNSNVFSVEVLLYVLYEIIILLHINIAYDAISSLFARCNVSPHIPPPPSHVPPTPPRLDFILSRRYPEGAIGVDSPSNPTSEAHAEKKKSRDKAEVRLCRQWTGLCDGRRPTISISTVYKNWHKTRKKQGIFQVFSTPTMIGRIVEY